MKELEFYKCENCDFVRVEVLEEISDCCNDMMLLEPNTVDASTEKHMPVLEFNEEMLNVKVGSVMHPMTNEHLIKSVYIVTDNGVISSKEFNEGENPEYSFKIDDAKEIDVYALCNIHGVWKTNIKR